jgi:hypothetical protein
MNTVRNQWIPAFEGVKKTARLREVRCTSAARPSTACPGFAGVALRMRKKGEWHYGLILILSRRKAPSRWTHCRWSETPTHTAADFFTASFAGMTRRNRRYIRADRFLLK